MMTYLIIVLSFLEPLLRQGLSRSSAMLRSWRKFLLLLYNTQHRL
ncbi:hypothetical protein OGY83_19970 [Citrobacter sp. Cpo090]|nr:hypothetical protein [Citrobacter sp. Cpo090]MDM2845891.1 hypothetical protein [Citrobacter sp. Cpo090]